VKVLLNKLPKEEEVLIKVSDDLNLIQTLFRKNKEFRNFLLNPGISFEDKKKVLDNLSQEAQLNETVKEAVKYVVKQNKANVLKYIADEFKFEIEKFFATVKGEIITAFPIDEETVNQIKETVEKKLGKKVEFETKQDPSIIGGMIVKAGSYVLDSSIKTQLLKLEQQLSGF
ncbi:MAG: ATP synthase F1 subunit delta, partial [Aquificota bacterium]